jgi:predicted dehydrogenase
VTVEEVSWGILGTGAIASKFAEGLQSVDGAELAAVGSRDRQRADVFGEKWDAPRRHGCYVELADDPEVDVVYVATPHVFHRENSILCMEAGKAVLCEKPLAINAEQVRQMIDCARSQGVFLMEAMWTRFLPPIERLNELIAEGRIGEPRLLRAEFCFRAGWDPEGRLLNPELGGGALLDVGCYTVALASQLFGGPPEEVCALAHLGETGVDEQSAMLLRYAEGRLAVLTCAVRTSTPHEALVAGTEGWIRAHDPWWSGSRLTVATEDGQETLEFQIEGNGYNYEAAEVGTCLREGLTESETMPLEESLSVAETMDRIRQQWGLVYPAEE